MTVYADVVIAFNFTMNFLVLLCVRWVSGARLRWGGLLLSALLGGIYSVFMFDERFQLLYSFVPKIALSACMVVICFKIHKNFIKLIFYFYITSFAFCGVAVFINNFSGVLNVRNGIFYYENSIWLIIAACITGGFLVGYILKHMTYFKKRYGRKMKVTLSVEGREFSVTAMADSGNSLLDPITLFPVIVTEYECIKPYLPQEMADFLKEGSDLNCNMHRKYLSRIRLIPCTSIGGSDILKGFRPDYMKIDGGEEIKDVIVAVTYGRISESNEFDAILNPMM